MPVPDDPREVAAQFGAQLLGVEITDDPPPPGSPLWCLLLLKRLAEGPPLDGEEVQRVLTNYLIAVESYEPSEDD